MSYRDEALRQLAHYRAEELLWIPNIGKLSLQEIEGNLAKVGLSLARGTNQFPSV